MKPSCGSFCFRAHLDTAARAPDLYSSGFKEAAFCLKSGVPFACPVPDGGGVKGSAHRIRTNEKLLYTGAAAFQYRRGTLQTHSVGKLCK
jgi:hypothetical protein